MKRVSGTPANAERERRAVPRRGPRTGDRSQQRPAGSGRGAVETGALRSEIEPRRGAPILRRLDARRDRGSARHVHHIGLARLEHRPSLAVPGASVGRWKPALASHQSGISGCVRACVAERSAALDALCGSDDELRSAVERLIASHESAQDFLQSAPHVDFGLSKDSEAEATMPARIGPYRIVRKLGQGGMGAVLSRGARRSRSSQNGRHQGRPRRV